MIIWILESESGVKLIYKSFLKVDTDEDIVSGFLTAFNQFSLAKFQQSIESIEMGGLRWSYILEPDYNLLFVAADTKDVKTELLRGRLQAIKKAFIEEFKPLYTKRKNSWDGNLNVFRPFIQIIEDYYDQWRQVANLTKLADFYDVIRIFQQILIMLRNIIHHRMYSKARNEILERIESSYESLNNDKPFKDQPDLCDITFSKDEWFNIIDLKPIKCDKELVMKYIESIMRIIVKVMRNVKGKKACYNYFNQEKIYAYIFNNINLLKDLNLDMFILEVFLLL
ncbi:MAG: hypothetical protein EU539_11655 [Promethearchaeota archaeon]|nr:MAG: hypothetical protein EU539_11655 [Candidatus Lokiarchaeota archaeon]